MKRFGLLFLLSASYAGLLGFVFSTDFSRENSFLLPEDGTHATAKPFQAPVMASNSLVHDRIEAHDYVAATLVADAAKASSAGQSPESADGN